MSIRYVDSPYGKRLERLENMGPKRRRVKLVRNPEDKNHLPYDEWIPVHAVRFNADGTTSLMTEKEGAARNARYWIAGAIQHPGALRRQLGIPEGQRIPLSTLRSAAKAPGKLGQRARLALRLRSF